MEKPTQWGNSWEVQALPVLALPSVEGYQLYEAIRERLKFVHPEAFEEVPDLTEVSPALQLMLVDFNPLCDYNQMEWQMHNAISDLIPKFRNSDTVDGFYTESDILAKIGASIRFEPMRFYLSAKWLRQSYEIINLLRRVDIISISWIDESDNIYTGEDQGPYEVDKVTFQTSIAYKVAVIQPSVGDWSIFGASGQPSNVVHYTCNRDPCTDLQTFKNAFINLVSQVPNPDELMVGLSIDESGSMNQDTIEPAFSQFVAWINENYNISNLSIYRANDERWLKWTLAHLDNIGFNFQS